MWQPIPTVGGPDNTRQQDKPSMGKGASIERTNLRVVEGTPSTIYINPDKFKGLTNTSITAKQNQAVEPTLLKPLVPASQSITQPKQSNVQSKPSNAQPKPNIAQPNQLKPSNAQSKQTIVQSEQSNAQPKQVNVQSEQSSTQPKLANAQGTSQSTGFQGRMTASSFMKQAPRRAAANHPNSYGPNQTYRGVAGIPKSFLMQELMQRQLNMQQQFNSSNSETGWDAGAQKRTWDQSSPEFKQGQSFGHTFVQSDYALNQVQTDQQIYVKTDDSANAPKQQYSPSDTYADMSLVEENDDLEEDTDSLTGSKRLSAFQRLGPVSQPKKPKLTINLLLNKEQPVREVVDESEDPDADKYTPAYLRADVQTSLDDTVMKYLVFWPWKKNIHVRRTVTGRMNQSVMAMELEQMEEMYEKDHFFFQVSVKGFPASWNKEDVLDAVLEGVRGKSFIPCFIEFTPKECKFMVIQSRPALVAIHKLGFIIRKNDVELVLAIMQVAISMCQIDLVPRLVLKKRLSLAMEKEFELNLSEFTTKPDVSYFIYFPLNRVSNQSELRHLQSSVPWGFLTKLNLSRNRITSLSGFELAHYMPRLKHLDLSHNCIERVTTLLQCRGLPLHSLWLEGNPLCTDYIQQDKYIAVLKMMFSGLREVDGIELTLPGDFLKSERNYCPPEAASIVEKLLEVMFPLLEAQPDERNMENLYDVNAVMTITYMYKLRYGPIFKDFRTLFARARVLDEGDMELVDGASAISKLINRWPTIEHDPLTFTVDVFHHSETTTILRLSGVMKVTTESLADDEYLLSFTRTIVMHSIDAVEYKITNEMIYWDLPDTESAKEAFKMTSVKSKNLSLKLEAPPDEDLKERLIEIFMKLTEMERKPSERCLEAKNWHLQNAIDYFVKLLKLDNLQPLMT